jgi:hypothetical protein
VNLKEMPMTADQVIKFQKRNQLLIGLNKAKFYQRLEPLPPQASEPSMPLISRTYANIEPRVKSYVYPEKTKKFKVEKNVEEELIKAELDVGGTNQFK